jgi:hypothetical protein
MSDDLFTPTVRSPRVTGGRPWRPFSQVVVGLLGGTLAVTAIVYRNAGRLGAGSRERHLILLSGGIAFLVTIPLVVFAVSAVLNGISDGVEIVIRLPAVAAALVQIRILRRLDRLYGLRGGEYGSLWVPGFLAVFLGGAGEGIAIALIVLAVS